MGAEGTAEGCHTPRARPRRATWGHPWAPPRLPCPKQHLWKHSEDLLVDVIDAAGVHLVLELRPQGCVLLGGEEEGGGIAAPGQSGPARQETERERQVTRGRAKPLEEQRGHGTEAPPDDQGAPCSPTRPFPHPFPPPHLCSCCSLAFNTPPNAWAIPPLLTLALLPVSSQLPTPWTSLASADLEHRLDTIHFIAYQLPPRLNGSPLMAGTLPLRILLGVSHASVDSQLLASPGTSHASRGRSSRSTKHSTTRWKRYFSSLDGHLGIQSSSLGSRPRQTVNKAFTLPRGGKSPRPDGQQKRAISVIEEVH